MQKKSNQEQIQTTIENNLNTLKKLIKKNPIFSNNFYNKNFTESSQERNNKLTKKKNTLKNIFNNDKYKINNINQIDKVKKIIYLLILHQEIFLINQIIIIFQYLQGKNHYMLVEINLMNLIIFQNQIQN